MSSLGVLLYTSDVLLLGHPVLASGYCMQNENLRHEVAVRELQYLRGTKRRIFERKTYRGAFFNMFSRKALA